MASNNGDKILHVHTNLAVRLNPVFYQLPNESYQAWFYERFIILFLMRSRDSISLILWITIAVYMKAARRLSILMEWMNCCRQTLILIFANPFLTINL